MNPVSLLPHLVCKDIMNDLNFDINCIFTLFSVSDTGKFKCFILCCFEGMWHVKTRSFVISLHVFG